MKTITVRQLASIKRTAMNVFPMVSKKKKLVEKINSLNEELKIIDTQIEGWENAVISMTGYTSSDLINRTVETVTDSYGNIKKDKNGLPIKIAKYEPNEKLLSYNEDKKVWEVVDKKVEEYSLLPDTPEEININMDWNE